jgi:hypothetical protein
LVCIFVKILNFVHIPYIGTVFYNVDLFAGTANPTGENSDYNGLFLTKSEISDAVTGDYLVGLPVRIEHVGKDVGRVVTAWSNGGKLDILVDVDETVFEGGCVSRFVRDNVCTDFSLGYQVSLEFSDAKKTYVPSKKTIKEVSIVKKGARDFCHIHGYSVASETKRRKV